MQAAKHYLFTPCKSLLYNFACCFAPSDKTDNVMWCVMWWRCENIIALETFYMCILYYYRSKINKRTVCDCNLQISNGAAEHWLTLELLLWWEMNLNERHQLYETYIPAHWNEDLIKNTTVPNTVDKTSECGMTGVPQTIHSERLHRNRLLRAFKRLIEKRGKTL